MRRLLIALLVPLLVALSFAAGWFANEVLAPVAPQWMTDYATRFCAADAAYVAAHSAGALSFTEEEARRIFTRRDWQCDRVRFLGSSAGKTGTSYIFIFRDNSANSDSWWVFTTEGQTVVRID